LVFQSYLSWILLLLWIFHPRSPVRANGTFNRRDVLQKSTVTNKSLIYTQQKSTRFVLLQPWWILSVLLVFEELAITMIVLFRPDYAKTRINKDCKIRQRATVYNRRCHHTMNTNIYLLSKAFLSGWVRSLICVKYLLYSSRKTLVDLK